MIKLTNSKLFAVLVGGWIVYCLTVKAFDGAVVLLACYLFALHEAKKAANSLQSNTQAHLNN